MAFLSEVAKKAGDVMQGVHKSGERLRLQRLIEQKQRQFDELFAQIGRIYYEARGQSGAPNAAADELCNAVDALRGELERLKRREDVLANVRRCAACDAVQSVEAKFCGSCGEKLSQAPAPDANAEAAPTAAQPSRAAPAAEGARAGAEAGKSVFINWPDETKPEAQKPDEAQPEAKEAAPQE